MAIAKGQILSLNTPQSTVSVSVHRELLGLAIRNLVENAILHTAPGTRHPDRDFGRSWTVGDCKRRWCRYPAGGPATYFRTILARGEKSGKGSRSWPFHRRKDRRPAPRPRLYARSEEHTSELQSLMRIS